MNPTGNAESSGRKLTTADLAAAGRQPATPPEVEEREARNRDERVAEREAKAAAAPAPSEKLDPLFAPEMAHDYRARWAAVQSSFVDDPRKAARQGDELVAQVMQSLAESFAGERDKLEGQLGQTGEASTEILRVSLRRYRSFFERLLSL